MATGLSIGGFKWQDRWVVDPNAKPSDPITSRVDYKPRPPSSARLPSRPTSTSSRPPSSSQPGSQRGSNASSRRSSRGNSRQSSRGVTPEYKVPAGIPPLRLTKQMTKEVQPYRTNELRYTPRSLYAATFRSKYDEHVRTRTPKGKGIDRPLDFSGKRLRLDKTRGKGAAPSWLVNHHVDPYFGSENNTAKIMKENPEKFSFHLWGRINPSYTQQEFVTEARRTLRNHYEEGYTGPVDRSHFSRIRNKDYKNALAQHYKTMRMSGGPANGGGSRSAR